jgi:putative oxidoreductase
MKLPVAFTGVIQSLFRMVIGLLFVCHGAASVFGIFGGSMGSGHAITAGTWPGWYAAMIQMVAGALVLLGLATRPAAVVASGSMAYAYFTVHQEHGLLPILNGGEPAVMFCWTFLLIAMLGPGPLALDTLLRRSRRAETATAAAEAVTA